MLLREIMLIMHVLLSGVLLKVPRNIYGQSSIYELTWMIWVLNLLVLVNISNSYVFNCYRYTVTVTATMAHSESFMDDPQSSTVFEAKGLWREAFKSLYEFYQHKLLCDVEIEVHVLS